VTRHSLSALAFSCLVPTACAQSAAPPPGAQQAPLPVTIARVATTDVPERFESGGVVRARLTATLASRVAGAIESVPASVGARVRRGQTLLTLECRELEANSARARASLTAAAETMLATDADVRAADAALALATATQQRVRVLYEKRSATAQEWDQASEAVQEADARGAAARSRAAAARAARDAADAALRANEAAVSYATISAPFDGVVAERLVDPGTLASPGMPLLVVEDPGELRLHVQIDEFRARAIAVGQIAEVRLDQGGAWTRARIDEIGRIDPASHSFLVKLELPASPNLRAGLFARARFISGSRRGLMLPAASLVRRGQLAYVFTVTDDDLARLRPVVAGDGDGERIEILAGLADGDSVIVAPPPALTDGRRVSRQR
jgi:multidrug efflux pump subunit AcrA (membrane-fusion protein)